jgi:hypothetical protein
MKEPKVIKVSGISKTIMGTKTPLQKQFKAPDLTDGTAIPSVRPTSMRNLSPWSGFKKGKKGS